MCAKPSANVQKPFVNMQRRLQICKAACRFARPRAHVPESDFINTLCFNEVQASGDVRRPLFQCCYFSIDKRFLYALFCARLFGTTTEQLRKTVWQNAL